MSTLEFRKEKNEQKRQRPFEKSSHKFDSKFSLFFLFHFPLLSVPFFSTRWRRRRSRACRRLLAARRRKRLSVAKEAATT